MTEGTKAVDPVAGLQTQLNEANMRLMRADAMLAKLQAQRSRDSDECVTLTGDLALAHGQIKHLSDQLEEAMGLIGGAAAENDRLRSANGPSKKDD